MREAKARPKDAASAPKERDQPARPGSAAGRGWEMLDLTAGMPLDLALRARMERGLGHQLGDVRLHTGPAASGVTARNGARALAHGNDVLLDGSYRPGTLAGDALLAHELAHTVQQRGTGSAATGAGLEHEADHAAAATMLRDPVHGQAAARGLGRQHPVAVPPPRLSTAGLGLQRCSSSKVATEPEPPVTHLLDPIYATAVKPGAFPEAAYDAKTQSYEVTLDGDGDESAELRLNIRTNPPGVAARQLAVNVTYTPTGASQEVTFDVSDCAVVTLAPTVLNVTDGWAPTRIALDPDFLYAVELEPPGRSGVTGAEYVLWLKSADGQLNVMRNIEFANVPVERLSVFRAGEPRETAGMWIVDFAAGPYEDLFRLVAFKPDAQSPTVAVGIGAIESDQPIAMQRVDVIGPGSATSPSKLALGIVGAGVSLDVDLDGDGGANLRIFDRFTAQTSTGQPTGPRDSRRYRDHVFRAVGAGVDSAFAYFQVQEGHFVAISPRSVAEAELAGSTGIEPSSLTAEVAANERRRQGMRDQAAADGILTWRTLALWNAMSADVISLVGLGADGGRPSDPSALAAAQERTKSHTLQFFDAMRAEENRSYREMLIERGVIGPSSQSPELVAPMVGGMLVRWDFLPALEAGDWKGVARDYESFEIQLDGWIAMRLARKHPGGPHADFTVASAAVAVDSLELQEKAGSFRNRLTAAEARMHDIRKSAVDKKLIRKETFDAWDELSTHLVIELAAALGKPSATGPVSTTPDAIGPLGKQAAEAARRFAKELSAETTDSFEADEIDPEATSQSGGYTNPYTGERRSRSYDSDAEAYVDKKTSEPTAVWIALSLEVGNYMMALAYYGEATNRFDEWILQALRRSGAKDQVAQFEGLRKLEAGLIGIAGKDVLDPDKDPKPVYAVYHPLAEHAASLKITEYPLNLFYWREPASGSDPGEWHLKDLTNPSKPFENTTPVTLVDGKAEPVPPQALFDQLDRKAHFSKGFIYYEIGGPNGRKGQVETTEKKEASDYWAEAAMALGAAALVLATAGAGAVLVTACIVGSSIASVVAAGLDIKEHSEQGALDAVTVALDVFTIVTSIAGAAGSVLREVKLAAAAVAAAEDAGKLSPATRFLASAWGPGTKMLYQPLIKTMIAGDVINLLVYTGQVASTIIDIESNDKLSSGDRAKAISLALAHFSGQGALAVLSLRGNVHEYTNLRGPLEIGVSRVGTPVVRAEAAEFKVTDYQAALHDALAGTGVPVHEVEVKVLKPAEYEKETGPGAGDAVVKIGKSGKVTVLVVEGAFPHVIEEEAIHVKQAHDPRTKGLVALLDEESLNNWSTMKPADKLKRLDAKFQLEIEAQWALIEKLGATENLTEPQLVALDEAWQNVEGLRNRWAQIGQLETDLKSAVKVGDAELAKQLEASPLLEEAPRLYNRPPRRKFAVDDTWKTLSFEQFKKAYTSKYPETSLSPSELRLRWTQKRLLGPKGRLRSTVGDTVDVPAEPGDAKYYSTTGEATQPDPLTLNAEEKRLRNRLLKDREEAREARDKAVAKRGEKAGRPFQAEVIESSRKLGELHADAYMREKFPNFKRVYPPEGAPSRSGDFDRVYQRFDKGGRVLQQIVIEAKGGGSPLGSRLVGDLRVEQGTLLYFNAIVESMSKGTPLMKEIAADLKAAGPGSVRYLLVRTHIEATGVVQTVEVREFPAPK